MGGNFMRKMHLSILLIFCLTIPGCSSLQTSFNVLAFEEDDNSGKASQQFNELVVLNRYKANGRDVSMARYRDLLASSDAELQTVLKSEACRPEEASEKFAAGAVFTNVAVKLASIVYSAVFDELAAGAAKLQARATPPAYSVRLAAGTDTLNWQDVKCLVFMRRWLPDSGKGFDEPVNTPRPFSASDKGLTVVLQRVLKGSNSSTLRPVYLRMDNAVAVTGAGTADNPASVQATIAFVLTAVEGKADKQSVKEVAKIAFPTMKLPLNRSAKACRLDDPLMTCDYDSDLIRDPNDADAIGIAMSITEVGSPADAKARSEAGIKALKEISQPFFDAFLAEIKAAAK
jgi:hypothetical protein